MTPDEVEAVRRLLGPAIDLLEVWSARHPTTDLSGVFPTTLLMCSQFPDMGVDETVLRAESCFWITAIDTFLDDPGTGAHEAETLAAECIAIALAPMGGESVTSDYGAILFELKRDLGNYSLYEALHPAWAVTVARLLDSMMFEYWISQQRRDNPGSLSLPSLPEYLYFARNTIGLPFVWITGTILANDRSVLRTLPSLVELTNECGVAMRLANDLRTFEREDGLGEVNALHLIAPGLSVPNDGGRLELARAEAQALVARSLKRAQELANQLTTNSGIEKRYVRSTFFGVDLYTKSDYHTDSLV